MNLSNNGFSLVEVVIASGILGVGMVVLLGYTAPIAASLGASDDEFQAAAVSESIAVYLRAQSFDTVVSWVVDPYEAAAPGSVRLWVDRAGMIVASPADPVWQFGNVRFFEVTLVRRPDLTPAAADATAAWIAFDMKIVSPIREYRVPGALRR